MNFSIAPFPTAIWSSTHPAEFEEFLHPEPDTSFMVERASCFKAEQEPLWYLPTDQLRTAPLTHTSIRNSERPTRVRARHPEAITRLPTVPSDTREGVVAVSRSSFSGEECGYCRSVGKPSDGHPKTACPALFALKPCSLCGADGYDNHTLMHCPSQKKVKLQLKNGYRRLGDCRRYVERLPMWNSTETLFAAIY